VRAGNGCPWRSLSAGESASYLRIKLNGIISIKIDMMPLAVSSQ
jgi:hypothetical protein